ncbi:MTA/SAH nucleosidase [Bacteroides thetaiotaomicron]|nr:MTA/SAH nucleosidase [Bacteroides thetaiotaomicron]
MPFKANCRDKVARCRALLHPYGIGKVKSAFHLAEAIRQVQPDLVLNLGSAGTVNHQVGISLSAANL